jgi:FAD-linked sulfhydryl oxidase
MPKKYWGPPAWHWGHLRAIFYPDKPSVEDRRLASNDVSEFISRLPCEECRNHATVYVGEHPLDLANSDAFQMWWFTFHNAVNVRLKKPEISYTTYYELYSLYIAKAGKIKLGY